MTPTFLDKIRHIINPLHIYCRLRSMGIPSKIALWLSNAYETLYIL